MENLVCCANRGRRTGANAFVLAGKRCPGLIKHLYAVHNGIVHEAGRQLKGLARGGGQHQPCAGGAAGQGRGHLQAHMLGGRRKVKGRARRFLHGRTAILAIFVPIVAG
mgnify:CR=1 FL=1